MPLPKKLTPLFQHRGRDNQIFVSYSSDFFFFFFSKMVNPFFKKYTGGGHFLDPRSLQPMGKFILWRFLPLAVGTILFIYFILFLFKYFILR